MSEIEETSCPICSKRASSRYAPKGSIHRDRVSCDNCGDYLITEEAQEYLKYTLARDLNLTALISHNIRRIVDATKKELAQVTVNLMEQILSSAILPSIGDQADHILIFIAKATGEPGVQYMLNPNSHIAVAGSKTRTGFDVVVNYLNECNYITKESTNHYVSITYEGWKYYEQLLDKKSDSRLAFMAMEFGHSELNQVLERCFKPAVKQTGFTLEKLDDTPEAGLIDDTMRVRIRQSRFVIADLSHGNRGAYWEAGYAEGLGLPVIYTCEKNVFDDVRSKPHFDTNHHLTVVWDPDNLELAASQLKATIRATLPGEATLIDEA